MAYRSFRPMSANMVQVKKTRTCKIPCEFEKSLKYDPWVSIYKENYGPESTKNVQKNFSRKKNVEIQNQKKNTSNSNFFGIQSEKIHHRPKTSLMKQTHEGPEISKTEECKSDQVLPKKQLELKSNQIAKLKHLVNTYLEKNKNSINAMKPENMSKISKEMKQNVLSSDNQISNTSKLSQNPANLESNGPVIRIVKPNATPDAGTLYSFSKLTNQTTKKRPSSASSGTSQLKTTIRTTEELIEAFPELKKINEQPPFQNIIGQAEEWLDAKDQVNAPVHSKIINFHPKEFLKANIKILVNTSNEYYPYLTGKCMCNQCICGDCKCVHFKYKPIGNCFSNINFSPDEALSEYKREFGPKKMNEIKRKIQPNEIHLVPSTINYMTSNSLNFKSPVLNILNNHTFLNKAKLDNLGPGVCNVSYPMESSSTYKTDYPDFKCVGTKPVPHFIPATIKKNMPFMGKPVNQEYGAFARGGEILEPRKPFLPENKNNIFPVFESVSDFPLETDYKRNFKPKNLGDDPLKHFKPVNNLELEVT